MRRSNDQDLLESMESRITQLEQGQEQIAQLITDEFREMRHKFIEPSITAQIERGFAERIDNPGLKLAILLNDTIQSMNKEK